MTNPKPFRRTLLPSSLSNTALPPARVKKCSPPAVTMARGQPKDTSAMVFQVPVSKIVCGPPARVLRTKRVPSEDAASVPLVLETIEQARRSSHALTPGGTDRATRLPDIGQNRNGKTGISGASRTVLRLVSKA